MRKGRGVACNAPTRGLGFPHRPRHARAGGHLTLRHFERKREISVSSSKIMKDKSSIYFQTLIFGSFSPPLMKNTNGANHKPMSKFFTVFFCIIIFSHFGSIAQVQNISIPAPHKEELMRDASLLEKVLNEKFKTYKKTCNMDTIILSDILGRCNSNCMANPKEPFNESDLKLAGLCNVRLNLYGVNRENEITFVVYQEGAMGGVETNCIIYKKSGNHLLSYMVIGISNDVYTISKIRRKIKNKDYLASPYGWLW